MIHDATPASCPSSMPTFVSPHIYRHAGGVAEYRSSEGKTVLVPYRGPVRATVQDILGGIRSTCTYVGASKVTSVGFLGCVAVV